MGSNVRPDERVFDVPRNETGDRSVPGPWWMPLKIDGKDSAIVKCSDGHLFYLDPKIEWTKIDEYGRVRYVAACPSCKGTVRGSGPYRNIFAVFSLADWPEKIKREKEFADNQRGVGI